MAISLSVEGTTCNAVKGTNGRCTISRLRVRVRHGTLPERELVQRRSEPEGNFHIAAAPGTDTLYVHITTARVTAAVKLESNTDLFFNYQLNAQLLYSITIYTGCPKRNVPDLGRVFLRLKYTDITQNTYVQS